MGAGGPEPAERGQGGCKFNLYNIKLFNYQSQKPGCERKVLGWERAGRRDLDDSRCVYSSRPALPFLLHLPSFAYAAFPGRTAPPCRRLYHRVRCCLLRASRVSILLVRFSGRVWAQPPPRGPVRSASKSVGQSGFWLSDGLHHLHPGQLKRSIAPPFLMRTQDTLLQMNRAGLPCHRLGRREHI